MNKSVLWILALLCANGILAQSEIDKVKATVNKSDIEAHIYFLADDLLKGREAGTPENKIAAAYLANTLRSYGVKPSPKSGSYYQEISLVKKSAPKSFSLELNDVVHEFKIAVNQAEQNGEFEGIYLGYGLESDYEGKDLKQRFVIVKSGGPDSKSIRDAFGLQKKKEALAKEAGALGIIELVEVSTGVWGRINHYYNSGRLEIASAEDSSEEKDQFAYIWAFDLKGRRASEFKLEPTVNINIGMDLGENEEIKTQNVIGVVEGTDPKLKNEYIIYSAHYDHVGIGRPDSKGDSIYNGARDNAVGTTTVLSMAENLAKYPTRRSALFILFTAEEKGLLGSKYYVENPVLPLEQMVYCFNSDNGGYNDTSLATIVGLDRTTARKNIVDAAASFGLRAIEDPAPEQGLFDRSDNVQFAAKGIPAPTFSMGFSSFDGDVTKYYHRPGDHADSMDYDYLLKFFRAYVMAGRSIANDPDTPFWAGGDKYESAGNELYGN
ncbi:MAG: M28 family peptidase [Bacteroidia bacterium]|nr:M28 family peptidase [Bacteroidia bacterium]NNF31101.1 M28 family peptidase [Flavobacteriaceae bacterium]NNJ81038.1 M28 family peptidase [Flavobacteriaceae bacterium]NNK55563.1 M28 family peptidase [Flavobacteriaceae bacterium]NNM08853.1 M28 family peptidase [Flavobacteriaceae bacterium]